MTQRERAKIRTATYNAREYGKCCKTCWWCNWTVFSGTVCDVAGESRSRMIAENGICDNFQKAD